MQATTNKVYNVRIKLNDEHGTLAVLSHKGRDTWSYRTAKKHLKDVTAQIVNGERPQYRFAAIVEA